MIRSLLGLLLILPCSLASAECVEGALMKTKYKRLNIHTVALTGGYGDPIVIRTSCKISRKSQVAILQDAFCSESKNVITVDGEDCDADDVYLGSKLNENRLDDRSEWDFPVD